MLNITPEIADSIYTILIGTVGASAEEHFRWSFCYNVTFEFPNPMPYTLQSILVAPYQPGIKDIKKNNAIRVYYGDPIFLKFEEPDIWQIETIAIANKLIAEIIKKKTKKRRKIKCLV